jgi:hypothetical protein
MRTIYNAIRSTGNQNLILLNAAGGYTTAGLNPSTYASMTNVAWDLHFYNWMANNSTNLTANVQALQNEVAGAQATDNIPVVIGEYGNSSGALGAVYDPGGMQVVQAVEESGLSSAAWAWTSGNPTFPLLLNDPYGDPSKGLTQFGQVTQQFIAAGTQAPPSSGGGDGDPSVIYITPGSGSFKDAAGNTYTLDAAGNALKNGSPIPGGSGTIAMAYYDGMVCGQDRNTSQWYSWSQSTWAPIAPPPPPAKDEYNPPPGISITTGTGTDTLVLKISESAYDNSDGSSDANGDAAFTVSVDGKQLAGTFYATASQAAGATQTFTFKGNWGPGSHTVTTNFINDAWGGTGATDRNLFVDDVIYNGTDTKQTARLVSNGAQNFSVTDTTALPGVVTGAGSDTLLIKLSEDAYKGDAQFTVKVDGKQLGGTFTTTTLHSSGGSQAFAFAGDFGAGSHTVTVTFVNDLYAGTASTDRNLYVDDVIYNGVDTGKSAKLLANGSKSFAVTGGTTPSVMETGDHGSLTKNLSQTGTYQVGGDTFVLTSGNAAAVTLGSGTSQIKFLGAGSVTLTGGSGQATVSSDLGNNSFVTGSGSLDVTGGAGKDAYTYHAASGMLVVEDFSLAKGDTLTIDKSLQPSFHAESDGMGGSMLTFGNYTHGIDLHGVASFASSNVHWV